MPVSVRPLLQKATPHGIKWRVRLVRRHLQDLRSGVRLARRRGNPDAFPHLVCRYERPLIRYPGQDAQFPAKRRNVQLAISSVDRLVIAPGETFSFWRCVGRPARGRGYRPAAALRNRELTTEVGGALCLASTLLYNIALLSGMAIVERHCHSVDSYGAQRYFELGRDAAVEFAYLDLRCRNDLRVALMLSTLMGEEAIAGEVWSREFVPLTVEVAVGTPQFEHPPLLSNIDPGLEPGASVTDDPGLTGVRVRTLRKITLNGETRVDDLGLSRHHMQPCRERYNPGQASGPWMG